MPLRRKESGHQQHNILFKPQNTFTIFSVQIIKWTEDIFDIVFLSII